MSSINSVRKLQILYFSIKNRKFKNLKNGEKKWPNIGIYTYYLKVDLCKNRLVLGNQIISNKKLKHFIIK